MIILLLAPLLLLGAMELAVRAGISLVYGVPGKSYGIYRPDPVLGHFPAPNSYNHITTMNDGGFRNFEDVIDPRPRGALRVISYGGSTTFCPKLTTKECWPYQLEKRLRAGGGNGHHQVLNGGIVLWSLGHIIERARRDLPRLRPDTVILYSGFNELANTAYLKQAGTPVEKLVAEGRFGVTAGNYPASSWLYFHSLLFKIGRSFMVSGVKHFLPASKADPPPNDPAPAPGTKAGDAKAPSPADEAMVKSYLVVLERFIKLVRGNGAEPVFVIQASTEAAQERTSRMGAVRACALGVRVLDAGEAVAAHGGPTDRLFTTNIHFSAEGASALADYLYDRLYVREGFSLCAG